MHIGLPVCKGFFDLAWFGFVVCLVLVFCSVLKRTCLKRLFSFTDILQAPEMAVPREDPDPC